MYNFVHVLMLESWWKKGFYAAFQSTRDHYVLDVYLKPAKSLKDALSSPGRWVKQTYQKLWVELIDPRFLARRGAEICLWTNNFKGEDGVTVGFRYLVDPMKWIYATISIPTKVGTDIQLTYLEWGHRFEDYATDIWWERRWSQHRRKEVWPFFYPPKGTSMDDAKKGIIEQAKKNGFEDKIPFIKKALTFYVSERWTED